MNLELDSKITLNDGHRLPVLGLGTFRSGDESASDLAFSAAMEAGYRHFDSAAFYDNEVDVGRNIRNSGIAREELFVTTKLWHTDHGAERSRRAFETSFARLGLDYIDLYLIHWPDGDRAGSWRTLMALKDEGVVRSIGVSNYTIDHLEQMLDEFDLRPAVNQVEFHPFLFQKELLDFCKRKEIVLEAYSPLTKGTRLDHTELKSVAAAADKTVAQVLIRWALQHGMVVLPKSSNPERILQNSRVFGWELAPDQMRELDGLHEDWRCTWDPTDIS